MNTPAFRPAWGRAQQVTDRVVTTLERFLHIEAVSGGVLIAAALIALLWANSPFAASYVSLWHTPVTLSVGQFTLTQSLHFLVNDGLMTIFFLVAGLEIRRELHEGALASVRLATLPLMAALGGVIAPALIYLSLNAGPASHGWAVPIATDIAFALGVLALLGKSIPRGVRVLLLALAIIDDIAAVVVIALFYSGTLHASGLLVYAIALAAVLLMQWLGIRKALAYVVPGVMLWAGLLQLGVHPTLAGVMLGLLTPVMPLADRSSRPANLEPAAQLTVTTLSSTSELNDSLKQTALLQRDLIPPVVSVQSALHPWVAFGIMPLFALANAGVALDGSGVLATLTGPIGLGVLLGLLIGKPLGIVLTALLAVRIGWCQLPDEVGRKGLVLVGFLGGIGFTMAIFIANLAFRDQATLATAKLAILAASALAAIAALIWGRWSFARQADAL